MELLLRLQNSVFFLTRRICNLWSSFLNFTYPQRSLEVDSETYLIVTHLSRLSGPIHFKDEHTQGRLLVPGKRPHPWGKS